MAHLFVCQGRDEIPRWRTAFPQARLSSPQQARAWTGRGDRAWVISNLENWPALVSTLSGRGATVTVLSYAPHSLEAFQALNAGARGYAHALSPPELLRQVEVVTTNQGIWVWPELLAQVVGGTFKALGGESRIQEETLSALTERERDYLAVAARLLFDDITLLHGEWESGFARDFAKAGQKHSPYPTQADAAVEIVWEPAWDKDRMSEAAKLQLGLW